MARKFNQSDPTANKAIKKADRDRRDRQPGQRQPRPITAEFPDIFTGLLPHEAKDVALHAHHLAGGDVWAINREHLEQARQAVAS